MLAGKVKEVNSDLPGLLDEWASSLFRELDYVREAQNGVRFKKLYGDLEVCVPWFGLGSRGGAAFV